MKVGFDSPLPPARTGVADYAAALLEALRCHGTVHVKPRCADIRLYHLGNNQLHRDIYRRALAQPGVVVLHDAVLQHFFLGALNEQEYIEEFVYNYGEWHRPLAREMWRGRAGSSFNQRYFAYPMLRRIAEVSRAVIVHNRAAARMVLEHAPGARVIQIPLLFHAPELPELAATLRFRNSFGLTAQHFVFGLFGYLRESKRVLNILRAFERIYRARPETALLLAGEFVSQDLARAADPYLSHPGVLRLGHLDDRTFWLAASAVDLCLNLRYPTAGETSAIALRMMGLGKPVALTEDDAAADFPELTCLRIPPGVAEMSSLEEHGILAALFPQITHEIGRRAAEHVRHYHSLDRVAGLYWDTLCATCC
jgi:glycosyltransferase involved in cell wall biosynthesis